MIDLSRLSQAEIDMLLGGGIPTASSEGLSRADMDTVGEIASTALNMAASSLGELLSQTVTLTNPRVNRVSLENFYQEGARSAYIANVTFTDTFVGSFYLVFHERDAGIIVDILFGNDGSNPPTTLGEMELSALSEASGQLAGTMMTSFSSLFKRKVVSGPLELARYEMESLETPVGITLDDMILKADFRFELGTLSDSILTILIPEHLARDMVQAFEAATMPMPAATPTATAPVVTSQPLRDTAAVSAAPMAATIPPPQTTPMPMHTTAVGVNYSASHMGATSQAAVSAQPVQFTSFDTPVAVPITGNLELILDVPLQVTVELGRTKKQVKEVLELGTGSIIELDKLTGDPVDILVNGKPIAEGEVVIIDENFAVRITKIKNMADRLSALH